MHKEEGPSKIRPNPIKLKHGSAKAEGAKKQNAGRFQNEDD
jgi:hypothetical protein